VDIWPRAKRHGISHAIGFPAAQPLKSLESTMSGQAEKDKEDQKLSTLNPVVSSRFTSRSSSRMVSRTVLQDKAYPLRSGHLEFPLCTS
jgi:hypothetical protein